MRLDILQGKLATGQGTEPELMVKTIIGTGLDCGIVLAMVALSHGAVCLEYLGRTMVNSMPVEAKAVLHNVDEICVGDATFTGSGGVLGD